MIDTVLHHFNRLTVFLLEIAGVLAVLVFAAWIGLMVRLSHGPLNVDFLTAYVQKSLAEQQKDFTFEIGKTELVWGGRFEPFELQIDGAQINRVGGMPVLAVDRIGIQLSKRNLLFGQIVPRAITIHGPALRVVRGEDGSFTLNIAAPTENESAPEQPPQPGQPELIRELLSKLQERRLPLVGGLNQVSITDAAISYEDRGLHLKFRSRKSDISFVRGSDGISAEAHIGLALDDKQTAMLNMRAYYGWTARSTNVLAAFSGINLAHAAQGADSLKSVAGADLPLKGSFAMTLDADFVPGQTRFAVNAGEGTFNAGDLYATPIKIKSADIGGTVNLKTWEGTLEKAHVDLGGPVADATASSKLEAGRKIVTAQAVLLAMPVDDLKIYWPDSLTPDSRAWVTKNLTKGMATRATLDMELAIDDAKKTSVEKLGGEIDFKGIRVNYFPPLMPVLGVDGTAHYDAKSFNLDLKSGDLGDMKVEKSAIHITGLDTQDDTHHSKIDVAVSLRGPLKTALKVLDSDPLGYPHELGLKTEDVGGNADIDVGFKFPLYHDLNVKEVQVSAKAKLNDVTLKGLVSDYAITGGPMDLTVNNTEMKVTGSGKMGDMPVTFDWARNFAHDAATPCTLTAKLPLNAAALLKFGVPPDLNPGGELPAEVSYAQSADGNASMVLKGDITRTSFEVPFAGFKKEAGIPGTLGLTVHLKNGKADKITGLSMQTDKTALKGDIAFDANGVQSAAFGQLLLGDTDIALSAVRDGAGYKVNVSGRQIDLSDMLTGTPKPNSDADAAKKTTPLTVSLNVGRAITGKDKSMDGAKILLKRNEWQRLEQLELDATAGGGPVSIRYEPAAGGHSLHVQAANAGAALAALGVSSGVHGGKLSVDSKPAPDSGPRDMAGTVVLTDFTLVDVPVLGRLLNAMSLSGIIELLNGKGIAFQKARANFFWTDRGQPATGKNVRDIRIKDGATSGASLGLTFEGHIDQWANTYDLNGTIIPVSDLNKLISVIPIVGNILTANGEGIFAATYSIKGPKDQPTVTVNPLAVLAPGMLRKLFFEK